MAITITRADVKRKCMIASTDTSHDTDIDALIAEMQPSIQYTIADEYLNATSNTNLQAVLKLGITEIISGECLQQILRQPGASEGISIGGISVGARQEHGAKLLAQGTARLRPFMKAINGTADEAAINSSTITSDRTFTSDSMEVW
jgi:hypothetical protein